MLLVGVAFLSKGFGLIDAISIWSDDLYTVGKNFQSAYGALLAMLLRDIHPPLDYSLLSLLGAPVSESLGLTIGAVGHGHRSLIIVLAITS